MVSKTKSAPLPAVFFSHGGPTFMYREEGNPKAHDFLSKWGATIKSEWKPKYVVVVSAHWQSNSRDEINVAIPSKGNENDLIYDFGGFPRHYYSAQFKSSYSMPLAIEIRDQLKEAGFRSNLVKRGLDHGVWVPFKVAFGDLEDIPVIQVSLTSNEEDYDANYKLGQVLDHFRKKDDGALIVCSGMAVHNLRDLFSSSFPAAKPYTAKFNQLIRDVIGESHGGDELLANLKDLQRTPIYRQAHPTAEHFAPFVVGAGLVTGKEQVKEMFNTEQVSLGWGFYEIN